MQNTKTVYMVTYLDDNKNKHISFVQHFSEVTFLKDRFDNVSFEVTKNYNHTFYNCNEEEHYVY